MFVFETNGVSLCQIRCFTSMSNDKQRAKGLVGLTQNDPRWTDESDFHDYVEFSLQSPFLLQGSPDQARGGKTALGLQRIRQAFLFSGFESPLVFFPSNSRS